MGSINSDRLLTAKDVQAVLGVTPATVYNWMNGQGLPRPIRIGGRAVRWRASELAKWLEQRQRAIG